MKKRLAFPIENKILIPFVCISLITVISFCLILYYTEYHLKLETEAVAARELTDYITSDINAGGYWTDPEQLLAKYQTSYPGDSLFVYNADGTLLFSRRQFGQDELILQDRRDNRLGWQIVYQLDQQDLRLSFIEEQRYMILAAVAMLLIIFQASVFIAHNISAPVRQLSDICTQASRSPKRLESMDEEYLHRRDELGQLAVAFQSMIESLNSYTDELTRIKVLNESIVENLPLGVAVYDHEGSVLFCSSPAASMLERDEERDSSGHTLSELILGMVRRDEVLPLSVQLQDREGRIRFYDLGAWKLSYPEQERWNTLCTIDDVTYKKYMEEKVGHDEKLAYTGKLAAHVAHEARNPLAGIRAGLQVIAPKLELERDQLLCREMVKEVDRVNLLIENLLNLSRKRESKKTSVNLNILCDELMMLYHKVGENKGIRLSAQLRGNLWLFADEGQLKQIFINLINNSIKALPDGGWVLLEGAVQTDKAVLTVTDNGSGMDRATLEQAMRGDRGGLGLAIVRQLLKENNGTLDIESAPGQGTRITLTFHGATEQEERHEI